MITSEGNSYTRFVATVQREWVFHNVDFVEHDDEFVLLINGVLQVFGVDYELGERDSNGSLAGTIEMKGKLIEVDDVVTSRLRKRVTQNLKPTNRPHLLEPHERQWDREIQKATQTQQRANRTYRRGYFTQLPAAWSDLVAGAYLRNRPTLLAETVLSVDDSQIGVWSDRGPSEHDAVEIELSLSHAAVGSPTSANLFWITGGAASSDSQVANEWVDSDGLSGDFHLDETSSLGTVYAETQDSGVWSAYGRFRWDFSTWRATYWVVINETVKRAHFIEGAFARPSVPLGVLNNFLFLSSSSDFQAGSFARLWGLPKR